MLVWLQYVFCTGLIVISGARLSKYGDVLAEKTHMGRTWIGVLLVATVTSLPELITGVSSVAIYNLPNVAAGDVLGSCMFNLLILAALDIGRGREPITYLAHQGQVLTAAFGILLLGLTTTGILGAAHIPAVGWIGLYSFVLLLLYFVAMRIVFRYERKRISELLSDVGEEARYSEISKSDAYRQFVVFAVIIVGAATYLPRIAEEIASTTGLGLTFVGSIFVALSTSLPEIAVSRAALKIGAVDLAVGNVLGSNLFNIAVLSIDDIFYFKGPLLSHVSRTQAVTASAAVAMTAMMMIAMTYRTKKKVFFFSWESVGIFLVYGAAAFILFKMG